MSVEPGKPGSISRRGWLAGMGALALTGAGTGALALRRTDEAGWRADVFVAKAGSYSADLPGIIRAGLTELGLGPAWVRRKSILLKPNLVEPSLNAPQINTNPAVVHAVAEVFRSWDAREVFVAEGQGHCRDTAYVLEQSGLGPVLDDGRIEFVDLNHDDLFDAPEPRWLDQTGVAAPAVEPPAGRPGGLAAEAQDAPLGRCHPGDEESVRHDAGRGLWLAQERPASDGNRSVDPRHQRGGPPRAWRSSTGSSGWRGTAP